MKLKHLINELLGMIGILSIICLMPIWIPFIKISDYMESK